MIFVKKLCLKHFSQKHETGSTEHERNIHSFTIILLKHSLVQYYCIPGHLVIEGRINWNIINIRRHLLTRETLDYGYHRCIKYY